MATRSPSAAPEASAEWQAEESALRARLSKHVESLRAQHARLWPLDGRDPVERSEAEAGVASLLEELAQAAELNERLAGLKRLSTTGCEVASSVGAALAFLHDAVIGYIARFDN